MKHHRNAEGLTRQQLRAGLHELLLVLMPSDETLEIDRELVVERFLARIEEGISFEEELPAPAVYVAANGFGSAAGKSKRTMVP